MRTIKFCLFTLLIFLYGAEILPQSPLSPGYGKPDTAKILKSGINDFGLSSSKTPAEWMQKAGFLVNDLFIKSVSASSTFDTAKWDGELEILDRHSQQIFNVMVASRDKKINLIELYDLEAQVNGVMTKVEKISEEIKKHSENYSDYYYLTTLVSEENFLKIMKNDTNLINIYRPEFEERNKTAGKIGGNFLKYLKVLSKIENTKNDILNGSLAVREMLGINVSTFQKKIFSRDEPELWNIFGKEYPSYGKVLYNSFTFALYSAGTYTVNSWNKNLPGKLLSLLIPAVLLLYFYRLKRDNPGYLENLNYLKSYPLIISVIAFISLLNHALEYPPSIVSQFLVLVIMILVSIIIADKFIYKGFRKYYYVFFAYYVLITVNNFISESTFPERILFFLSIVPAFIIILYLSMEKILKRETGGLFIFLLYFLLIHLLTGFVLNLTGMVALCRVVITGGINSWFMAIYLSIAVKTAMDYVYLGSGFYNSFNASFKIDLEDIKPKILRLFGLFAVIMWITAYLTDIYSYNFVYKWLSDFLLEDRKIGNIEYTAGTIVIFIFVLSISFYISGLIRKIIEVNDFAPGRIERSNAGGFLLILRLFIISFGFLIALAVSGLPLDKLTILISALSVGIGFGLQNIINNLVSGVIIAMEKPFRIGDFVNVAGLNGIVKEIGIRSSTITTEDGSELIIPNGDLISKNLINWTSNNKSRKAGITVEIESKISKSDFLAIINDALSGEIISNEISRLQMHIVSFNRGIQKWNLNFWINDLSKILDTKSTMVHLIFDKLTEKEIAVISCE
jgi:potassium-dependent mechanosensitive channel